MEKWYRLEEVEELIAEMDLSEVADDVAEMEENYQLVISGWYVYIPSLNIRLHEGIVCNWDEEGKMFMPNFSVTVVFEGNIKGFATVVLGDSFKITNIAILNNPEKDQLFVSMPRYKSNERSESGEVVYKDICNPITKEFRQELYESILEAFETIAEQEPTNKAVENTTIEMPELLLQ